MKKLLSVFLAFALLLTSFTNVLAVESNNAGKYNSLKLPVVNEIRDESAQEMGVYGMQPMSLRSAGGELPSINGSNAGDSGSASDSTSGGSTGGDDAVGGGGSAIPEETPESALIVTGIPEQTLSKDNEYYIYNITENLSTEVAEEVEIFADNFGDPRNIIEYTKDGKTSYLCFNHQLYPYYSNNDDIGDLIIPVPSELENGTYDVKVHMFGNSYAYMETGYQEMVFYFELTVTDDAEPEYNYGCSINQQKEFRTTSASIIEGYIGDIDGIKLYFKDGEEKQGEMSGFAISNDGTMCYIEGYAEGNYIFVYNNISELPAGKYDIYFYEKYEGTSLYGPVTLNIQGIAFENEYFHELSRSNWASLRLGPSAAKKLPLDITHEGDNTLSMNIKNSVGTTVQTINNIPIEDFYLYGFENVAYQGEIQFILSIYGLDAGLYTADITLINNKTGDSYELGEASLNITDKTIINDIYILNYRGELSTATNSFYVCVHTSNIFTDYDKLSINLVDETGKVVAKTVSKELQNANSYNGSVLLYKLNVTEPLKAPDETRYYSYALDIQSESDVELITSVNNVYIQVSTNPMITYAEYSGANTVKVYTENLIPGEYLVVSSNNRDEMYDVIIDEQGVGTFQIDANDYSSDHFTLMTLDGKNIGSFGVVNKLIDTKFESTPEFISVNTTKIENFIVTAISKAEKPSAENIEYARIIQNGEVIATINNIQQNTWWSNHLSEGHRAELEGDLIVEPGKNFVKGNATFEIKYKDGFIYTNKLPVTDETTGLFGNLSVNNSCNYFKQMGNYSILNIVGDSRPVFTIANTNAATGTVSLYMYDEIVETYNLSELTKEVSNDYYYTYTGAFNTEINSDNVYSIVFEANNTSIAFNSFSYFSDKKASLSSELTAYNNNGYIYLYDWINISNIENLTFKAVMGNTEYDIPVIFATSGDNSADFDVDFSGVPSGYFTLKAYDGSVEVSLEEAGVGYNYGNNVKKPIVDGSGWRWVGENNETREFRMYGAGLDKVNTAIAKIYKVIDFPESNNNHESYKLQYVKDITLPKPYNEHYIALSSDLLANLETGAYMFVYLIDGVAVETQSAYISGYVPTTTYKANIVLNGGIAFTNKTSTELSVSSTGYTKMKVALSSEALAQATYEPIVATKNIPLEGKTGLVTVYVQFANDDESKTETLTSSITVDSDLPVINDVNVPELELWRSKEITFTTNKLLKNAFMVVGELNSETGNVEGRNYTFIYAGGEEGKYKYGFNLYADSQYLDATSLKAQIVAYDKAGNKAQTEIMDLAVSQPRSISGTLTYNGSVVKDASVYLYDENGYCVQHAYTNNEGKYTITDITKGNYTIKVNSRLYTKAELSVKPEEFVSDITGKNFALTSAYSNESTVTVSVKDYNNEPVANAKVSLYCWDADVNIGNTTNQDGIATIKVPYKADGTQYRVYVNHNDYSKTQYILVNDATETVDFSFPKKATISGIALRGETGVANTEITITGNNYTTYTQTNENGEFTADVYLENGNKSFVVSVRENTKYSGSETVAFADNSTEANVTLNLKGNIRVKGAIKDNMSQPVKAYDSISFSGNGFYLTVTPDANGEFETPDVFGAGTYNVYAYASWPYTTINETVSITDDDLTSLIKELNLTAQKSVVESKFTTGDNKITATADVISKGDTVTVNVKFQNDGTTTLSNVTAYAKVPAGADVISTNGVSNNNGTVSKTITTFKADDVGTLTFTIDTDNYNEKSIIIPAYVKANNKEYPIGAVTIEIVSVTLSAPQVVKTNTAFKVSGEAISGSTVEILNYSTKEVLATTDLTSKWYFADIGGISTDTTLIAKVTKDGKISYSTPVTVKVEENPITLKDVKINWGYNLEEFGMNENFGYPTLSIWEGYDFTVSTSFENIPANATVKYSFINKKNVMATKSGEYYKGKITNWNGYGTKKVIATVTVGDKKYEFIVAELVILIDPSGYITDSETGNPVVGANVLLEVKSGNEWITWDATPHLQQNPMLTDDEGHYGWMVPEGEYRIIVTADGYETKVIETYDSRDYGPNSKITVLPVRTDVDITLVNTRAVEIDSSNIVSVAGGRIKFVFTRPINPATVNAENFKVLKTDGTEIAGSIILSENNTVALFKPVTPMENGSYKLSVSNIKDGNNNVLATEEITFTKTTDIGALSAPAIAYNADGTIAITFATGKAPVNAEEIVVKKDNSVVNGTLRKDNNVITFIPDVSLSESTTYKVTISDAIHTNANEYLTNAYEKDITTPGGTSTPGNPPVSSGGGGGGAAPSVSKPVANIAAGKVEYGTKLELTTKTKDAVIYYTIDGTEPTEKSTAYSEAITINEDITIKAIAIKGKTKSSVLTAKYTVEKAEIKEEDRTEEKPTTLTPAFADIANYDWANESIVALAEKGIIKGISETNFAPANDIKRADFMLLLVRMLDLKADISNNFEDVASDKYYYEGIGIAKALGLTSGVGENKFNPEASITRQDMFVLAYRILQMQKAELISADDGAINTFADYGKISDYAKEGLSSLVKNELVKGSDNKINPVGNATRAETAVFIYRLYKLLNK